MSQNVNRSVLFNSSAETDVQYSGGNLLIPGLTAIPLNRIVNFSQINYRAEVVQVLTVGGSLYTPTGSTLYSISIGDSNRRNQGYTEPFKKYSYLTPAVITSLGATAALQREAITVALIAKINAASVYNYVTAATLTGGAGFTITDAAGYFPYPHQGVNTRQGATRITLNTNADSTGFSATDFVVTTAAVYSSGVGLDLSNNAPVMDFMTGNVISGTVDAPKTLAGASAVSGQKYNCFSITYLSNDQIAGVTGTEGLRIKQRMVWVDNGTGSSVTNLAGYIAFERKIQRAIAVVYGDDSNSIVEFFDNASVFSSTTTGVAPAGTDNVALAMSTGKSLLYVNPIGTATIVAPLATASGLPMTLDATTQEGYELSAPILTQSPKQFVVGKSEASFYVKFNVGAAVNATSFKSLSIGFRKKAVYAVDQTAYEAASVATACVGFKLDTGVAPVFHIITGPGSAGALTSTSTSVTPAASSVNDVYVTVDINGVANFYVNGTNKTGVLAATYTFTAGLNLIPFISTRHAAAADAAPFLLQAIFVNSAKLIG